MTEQEAEELAQRLERVWKPDKPVVTTPWAEKAKYGDATWFFHLHWHNQLSLEVLTSEWGNGPSLRLTKIEDNQDPEKILLAHLEDENEDGEVSVLAQDGEQWLPFFRRGCWLSGLPIHSSADEKAEWLQEFSREQIEAWNLEYFCPGIGRESQRVAAAFGVEWENVSISYRCNQFKTRINGIPLVWAIGTNTPKVGSFTVGENGEICRMFLNCGHYGDEPGFWDLRQTPCDSYMMACALYRLGFDEDVLCQFPPLSFHEKLELRFSMPREFWPQKWLDEEPKP